MTPPHSAAKSRSFVPMAGKKGAKASVNKPQAMMPNTVRRI